ncbi:MAG: Fis family transcriptional regulator [Candidatus Rokubacteria bacterium RIFCSPHIGHO2_12_FULL_73_22]|nr:MAG: Fis family transcriptional regulator [Candidatus Rokubacteria bacterium RIFCSPHIGHO2_12_FULL_73_22]OGL10240.1 MAG: Fis family transcriptional regulator [Candidatus Rokubacteria bacterium RIFCSPLOWO2_02_FULL_73_56]OGL28156.1 MAG: Fis family transcriptional regulator [Candidatus Rokubacteria bacterium RIFCSPLOWO2_12_FULL_73_47]
MAGEHILIVDDEPAIQASLRGVLEDEGYRVSAVGSGADAHRFFADEAPDLTFLDIWMEGADGLETLAEIKRLRPDAVVVMISGHGTIETAVKATRLGAWDFIEKPLALEKTLVTAARALEHARLARENAALRESLGQRAEILGESVPVRRLREQIATAAPTSGRVLIHGENGSGKELVARAIHAGSARHAGPFVEVNCAAIPEELIESELFGHEKGAFTGAHARRRGKFELADGGTLFLDEIGDMSLKTQAKVLRALEERAFERVGGKDTIRVDVRVIAASNRDLEGLIRAGRFRDDLYYRLNVIPIEVPPLRERRDDVPALVDHFVALFCAENGKRPKTLSGEALAYFLAYDWPGNVRELRNMLERLVIMAPGDVIDADDLPAPLRPKDTLPAGAEPRERPLREARDNFERAYILAELRANDWNMTRTAERLGIERSHLYRKIKAYGIAPPK